MSIRFHRGYWTIFNEDMPIASFADFESAWLALWPMTE
jgi:hypothetical protein